jgi:hypothetical protein
MARREPTLVLPRPALARATAHRILTSSTTRAATARGDRVRRRARTVAVSVADDGPGRRPRRAPFERSTASRAARTRSACRRARAHLAQGGALRLEQSPGRTQFVLELPVAGS